jgi:hypothetical protein
VVRAVNSAAPDASQTVPQAQTAGASTAATVHPDFLELNAIDAVLNELKLNKTGDETRIGSLLHALRIDPASIATLPSPRVLDAKALRSNLDGDVDDEILLRLDLEQAREWNHPTTTFVVALAKVTNGRLSPLWSRLFTKPSNWFSPFANIYLSLDVRPIHSKQVNDVVVRFQSRQEFDDGIITESEQTSVLTLDRGAINQIFDFSGDTVYLPSASGEREVARASVVEFFGSTPVVARVVDEKKGVQKTFEFDPAEFAYKEHASGGGPLSHTPQSPHAPGKTVPADGSGAGSVPPRTCSFEPTGPGEQDLGFALSFTIDNGTVGNAELTDSASPVFAWESITLHGVTDGSWVTLRFVATSPGRYVGGEDKIRVRVRGDELDVIDPSGIQRLGSCSRK